MKRAELEELKSLILEKREKSADLDVLMEKIAALPYGQLKKVLTEDVLAVLAKYGYGEA